MKLKCKVTGIVTEFPDEQAIRILNMAHSGGFDLVEDETLPETELPTDDFSVIDGITPEMIKKLKKKGIVSYDHLFTICEKSKALIGITDEMLEQTKLLLKNAD